MEKEATPANVKGFIKKTLGGKKGTSKAKKVSSKKYTSKLASPT
jgi:hypothetical protein